jgi:hypothetical protein
LLLCSCTDGGSARPSVEPTGPPTVRPEVAERHAREFRTDLSDREPGSQGEEAASVYLLGHLQQAGYTVLLDPVPVANLVRSTNVVALPPSGADPTVVVVVPYDDSGDPGAIGSFLELARALRVAAPEHSVEFVALGAESAGRRGSRRLIESLDDPRVVELGGGSESTFKSAGLEYSAVGDAAALLDELREAGV